MTKEMVKVGIANEGETNMEIDKIKDWKPKNVLYANQIAYFKYDNKFYSMDLVEFKRIFNNLK